jgi:hypothetical protein
MNGLSSFLLVGWCIRTLKRADQAEQSEDHPLHGFSRFFAGGSEAASELQAGLDSLPLAVVMGEPLWTLADAGFSG